jgi:Spy/CpxP family protein refolding chaperone
MSGRSSLVRGAAILLIASAATAQPPPGFPLEPPRPGQVLPSFQQQFLKLSGEQKKQVEELQTDVDARLAKILTAEQKKSLQDMSRPMGGFGRGPGAFAGPPPFGGPGFGPPGFGGPTGPSRLEDAKKLIDAREEEWKVIGPKLQKVVLARQVLTADARVVDAGVAAPPRPETKTGEAPAGEGKAANPAAPPPPSGGMFGGSGTNIISQVQADLRAVLADPKHTPAEVQEKITAIRKAREKVRAELEAAQKDLLQLLTAEQAAILVARGYLE